MISKLFRRKSIAQLIEGTKGESALRKRLGPLDLTFIGIGATLGTGIFVLTGIEAAVSAGPSIIISFGMAGLVAAFAALSYAELASMVPVSGSAYTYSYATIGEFLAWMVGWNLILEYAVSLAAVASGWSAYVLGLWENIFKSPMLPEFLTNCPKLFGGTSGGGFDLMAGLIVIVMTSLLVTGVKESLRINNIMVVINLLMIVVFAVLASPHIDLKNWNPFFLSGQGFHGTITAASVVFFAYLGFDAVSTSSEEAKNPQRDLPLGIIASLVVCSLLYMLVSAILTGIVPVSELNTPEPVAFALQYIGYRFGSGLVAIGALFGLTCVIMTVLYGQTRIFFAMSRDGLIPSKLCRVGKRFGTPYIITWMTGILVAVIASLLPVQEIAQMSNIGTYFAFITTSIGVLVLRKIEPNLPRKFKCPLVWLVATLAILMCAYFMTQLSVLTLIRFVVWSAIGILIYFFYGIKKSKLNQ
ncbi:MAG TPA: amino acid permease [Lentisphaeria bacterium]|nr:MAG: amino acid permease [Lentisphaerae bacterium GWF2_38_69]HBM16668.1 amino acid permease [Lentisphaeria bacterium]